VSPALQVAQGSHVGRRSLENEDSRNGCAAGAAGRTASGLSVSSPSLRCFATLDQGLAPAFIQRSITVMSDGESAGTAPSGSGLPHGAATLAVFASSLL
jgi:hypothetical protein